MGSLRNLSLIFMPRFSDNNSVIMERTQGTESKTWILDFLYQLSTSEMSALVPLPSVMWGWGSSLSSHGSPPLPSVMWGWESSLSSHLCCEDQVTKPLKTPKFSLFYIQLDIQSSLVVSTVQFSLFYIQLGIQNSLEVKNTGLGTWLPASPFCLCCLELQSLEQSTQWLWALDLSSQGYCSMGWVGQ